MTLNGLLASRFHRDFPGCIDRQSIPIFQKISHIVNLISGIHGGPQVTVRDCLELLDTHPHVFVVQHARLHLQGLKGLQTQQAQPTLVEGPNQQLCRVSACSHSPYHSNNVRWFAFWLRRGRAHLGPRKMQSKWSPQEQLLHRNLLELRQSEMLAYAFCEGASEDNRRDFKASRKN